MSTVECPYCEADVEICHDDGYGYDEDQTHNQDCDNCEKTFFYTTRIRFYYKVTKLGEVKELKEI